MDIIIKMSWERDYYLHGRPHRTGFNFFAGVFEFGTIDEEEGKTFAQQLREEGLPVVEDAQISVNRISLNGLVEASLLIHGPKLENGQIYSTPQTD